MVHSTTCFLTLLAFSALTIHGAPMKARGQGDDANTAVSKLQCGDARTCDSPDDSDPEDGEFQSSQALFQLCTQDPTNPACRDGTFQSNADTNRLCGLFPNLPDCGKGNSLINGSFLRKCTPNSKHPSCRGGTGGGNSLGLFQGCDKTPNHPSCRGNVLGPGFKPVSHSSLGKDSSSVGKSQTSP